MRLSTVVIANSRSLAERVRELGLNRSNPVEVLGPGSSHGVDSAYFARAAAIPALSPELVAALARERAPVIGFIGRVHADKGIDVLIDALRLCADVGIRVQLLVVGPEEGITLPREIAGKAGIVKVHRTGFTLDPRPMLRAMDVLTLPSRREGFPNVVLEAAAMEVPAIVTDATGCVDAVIDHATGRIVPVDDAPALASAIAEFLGDDEMRAAMGEAARSWVVSQFAPPSVWALHSEAWRQTSCRASRKVRR